MSLKNRIFCEDVAYATAKTGGMCFCKESTENDVGGPAKEEYDWVGKTKNNESETPVIEALQKYISRNELQNLSDLINLHSREIIEGIGDAKIMIRFVKRGGCM